MKKRVCVKRIAKEGLTFREFIRFRNLLTMANIEQLQRMKVEASCEVVKRFKQLSPKQVFINANKDKYMLKR